MGKLTNRAQKRKDKKYNPYKLNPLNKKLNNTLMGDDLESAVETDEKGAIKLDAAGKPVFKDQIEWETNSAQIMALWTCAKELLEQRLVPPLEQDAAFDLLEIYAKHHRPDSKSNFMITLPVNYFVGTWHILNTCRKFHIFSEDKALDSAIDELTLFFARKIDAYHSVKAAEKMEEEVKPGDLLSLPKASYYKHKGTEKPKELE